MRKLSRTIGWTLAALAAALVLQVFFAGALVLADDQSFRTAHVAMGHTLELGAIVLAVLGFIARDRAVAWTGVALVLLTGAQNGLIQAPGVARGLHVVNAFLIFGATLWLLRTRMPWATASPAPSTSAQ